MGILKIKKLGHKLLGVFGYRLIKIKETNGDLRDFLKRGKWIQEMGIRTVLDIGANNGQFAKQIRKLLPDSKIYSFEPLFREFNILNSAFENDDNFTSFNVALGLENGKKIFFKDEFSASSSFLKMEEKHIENYPHTGNIETIDVEIRTLDSFYDHLDLNVPLFIKIDVQGFENQVISGGLKIISIASLLVIEICFETFYSGQTSFKEIFNILDNMGFKYIGNFNQSYSKTNGRVLFSDCVYIK
ncbi:FkbM family methyltransferase [Algoriphagus sp. C2-6-M1]|uniref:FkbM family methyltransferase n=1 Tax=Algoriphagus persicinus TaxID=3108754 RepID=UPI002B3DAFF5|nr:FkbM family methyltransferase [Algoriphagus sp. C2-6-M1]MEB2782421.1 FkbM family methyltransferase [Algoriphagus sp. C2-6-M1]